MAQLLCAVALVNVLVENQPDDLSFRFINHKVADFLILLVHPTKADTLVAKRHGAACIVAFPGELFQPCPGTDRGFQTFAGCLPVADVVHQLVHMGVKSLLSFVHAPDFDALLREPFHDKGRFIITATETVKHEHQQDVKLALHCGLLDFLEFITVFGRLLKAGNAFFGKFLDDLPALTFCKVAAGFFLHGDVVFLDLSFGRNTV